MSKFSENFPEHGFHPCIGCGNMMPHHSQKDLPENGWVIPLGDLGYYGGFSDEEKPHSVTLCHDCVIKLLELFPMFGVLIGKGGHSSLGSDEKPCCQWAWKTESINGASIVYLASDDGERWLAQ